MYDPEKTQPLPAEDMYDPEKTQPLPAQELDEELLEEIAGAGGVLGKCWGCTTAVIDATGTSQPTSSIVIHHPAPVTLQQHLSSAQGHIRENEHLLYRPYQHEEDVEYGIGGSPILKRLV